jgi:hypothetical protein
MGQVELKSLAELKSYNQELAGKKAEDDPVVRKLHVAKRITWVLLLAASFLAFYLMDKLAQALSMLK